jgi:hypothetical protein
MRDLTVVSGLVTGTPRCRADPFGRPCRPWTPAGVRVVFRGGAAAQMIYHPLVGEPSREKPEPATAGEVRDVARTNDGAAEAACGSPSPVLLSPPAKG